MNTTLKSTTINALLLISLLGLLGFVGPALDDNTEQPETAREELAKQQEQRRFAKAVTEMCGNGAWFLDPDGSVVCQVRKALKAGRARL
jgi:hypothetical protein